VKFAVREMKSIWPFRKVECIVSLGTGIPLNHEVNDFPDVVKMSINAATESEETHKEFSTLLSGLDIDKKRYFRFNPTLETINSFDGRSDAEIETLVSAANKFIETTEFQTQIKNLSEYLHRYY
jgi:hypothetical protein